WKSFLSAVVVIAVVTLGVELFRNPSSVYGQKNGGLPVSGQLIVHTANTQEGGQQMILVDPVTRVMAVYHVDAANGKVSLRSVRNLQWDLLIEEFNGGSPSPREIRTLLNQS